MRICASHKIVIRVKKAFCCSRLNAPTAARRSPLRSYPASPTLKAARIYDGIDVNGLAGSVNREVGRSPAPPQSPNSLLANATVVGLRRRRRLRDRGRLGWACLRWRLDCLRWRRVALARRRHLRGRSPRDGWVACDGGALRWPKFGFCALQSATSCRLICGKGLPARRGCGVHPASRGLACAALRPWQRQEGRRQTYACQ
jgi:hypothetical protein